MNHLAYRIRIIVFGCILSLFAIPSTAQNLSNSGKEFWVSYPLNWLFDNGGSLNSQEMVLYFSAEQAATVTVTSHVNGNTWTRTYNVPAGTVTTSDNIPKTGVEDSRLFDNAFVEGLFNKGIHIESNVPIVVYAHYLGNATSGAAMLFPVEAYGYSYVTLNNEQNYSNGYTYFYVMASEDNTFIEITPSVATRNRPAGVPFVIQLNKKQAYQIVAQNTSTDLTGSKIRSVPNRSGECLPIAVYCGSSRTAIGCTTPGNSGDFIMQQCFPSQAWGKRYLTAPTSNHSAATSLQTNVYRVLVKDPTTSVRRNGVPLSGLINNTYYHFTSNSADYVEADQPIMVAQYMASVQSSGCNNVIGPNGDPEMIYLSPVEQAIKRVGFYRNHLQQIVSNYLTLIIPSAGLSSLNIDGSSSYDHTYAHPNRPGYTVVVKRWDAQPAQCIVQSDSAFTAITYGLGNVESYGYNAGTLINNLNVFASVYNTADSSATSHQYTCKGTPMELGMLISYKPTSMNWQLSQVPSISPAFDVFQTNPTPVDSQLINGHWYYRYKLPGTYSFSDTGTFHIPVVTTHPSLENCNNSETVRFSVNVKPSPIADFTFSHTGCRLDTVFFSSPASSSNGYNINSRLWTFHDGTQSTIQNPQKVYATSGTFNVQLRVVAAGGCVGDTIRPITILNPPSAAINANPDILCEGGNVSFTGTSSYTGTAPINSWYWDFGNGNTLNASNNNAQTISYPSYGTYTVKLVAKVSNTCISDTATRVIRVNAKPVLGFTYPAGCLPANGVVQFNSTTVVPGGGSIASYLWNFGDPNANAGNPNTSTLANPTHIYTYGTYNVQYSVTSAAGCTKDTTVVATFNVRPQLAFSSLSPVCESLPGSVSVANASVTNAVTGTGIYKGPGTTAAGQFAPSLAGAGTHTIWYVFNSTGGCTDSVSQTILVHAKPRPAFTFPSGCLPVNGLVQFTNTSTIADAQGMTYNWDFGDPNANAGNPNNSTLQNPTHNYAQGTYSIKLTATSSNGCTKDTVVATTFSVSPQLSYPPLASVCENAGVLSVATATVTNNAPGTGVYSGPGVAANGDFNPALAGPGTHTIKYVFTATGNCKDSVSQTIFVNARPRPAFSFPTGCLPITGLVQFQNNSTIADAQTMAYSWNFGDPNANAGNPNTSSTFQPSHNYTDHGTYNVKLTATSSNGCIADTTITTVFSVRPQLAYLALGAVCESNTATSVATAIVTNGVNGTGVYRGAGTSANGTFNPGTAGPGTHTIWYVFTSTGNCIDSISQSINVLPKPSANFTLNTDICLDGVATFIPAAAIGVPVTSWSWNFGDGNTMVYNNDNSFTRTYVNHGNYAVQLVTTSNNGCTSDPFTRTIAVHALPVANFDLPAGVCMPNGTAPFANRTTIADNSAWTSSWDFGDGNTSNAQNGSHVYATAGSYSVTLSITSQFGCAHDTTRVLSSFFNKPIADFSVAPDTLCQGTNNVFTDLSSAPNSTITGWSWNFGDGSGSSQKNPTKRYINPGNYDVKLTVTNAVGCTSEVYTDKVIVYLQPVIDAGPSFVVPLGTAVKFNPKANDSSVLRFSWSPPSDFTNPNVLRPTLVAMRSQTYTLTAIGQGNCMATDTVAVKILKPVNIPNSFTPNRDGINDTWVITNLIDYPGSTVEVYNRYGQQVYFSKGYSKPWDGSFKGEVLPFATYYYIITLKNGLEPLTGSVTILK